MSSNEGNLKEDQLNKYSAVLATVVLNLILAVSFLRAENKGSAEINSFQLLIIFS